MQALGPSSGGVAWCGTQRFLHADHWQNLSIGERDINPLELPETANAVKRYSRERRRQFQTGKTFLESSFLAGSQEHAADASAGPCRMHEEGANPGWIIR